MLNTYREEAHYYEVEHDDIGKVEQGSHGPVGFFQLWVVEFTEHHLEKGHDSVTQARETVLIHTEEAHTQTYRCHRQDCHKLSKIKIA